METKGIGAFVSEGAALHPQLWRQFYDSAATLFTDDRFTFLNLGHLDVSDPVDRALDLSDARLPERLSERLYERAVEGIEIEGRTVLEVGCGRGGGCAHIASTRRPATLVGIDASEAMVEWCRAHHDVAGLRFEHADAAALPFADDSFDVVVNVESSHCYPSRPAFFREVSRVLRPGGAFGFADLLYSSDAAQTPAEIETALADAGLTTVAGADISAGVVAARQAVSDSKAFAERLPSLVPRGAKSFWEAYCLRGSKDYEALVDGGLEYWCWSAVATAEVREGRRRGG